MEKGDLINMTEICPGAGVSSQGQGVIEEILPMDGGGYAYMVCAEDGKFRLMTPQGRWGLAYHWRRSYEKKGEQWIEV